MRVGSIDFYHFIPLSVAFTLAGVTRSVESRTSWLHFLTHFSTDQDKIWYLLNQFKLHILILFLSEIYWNKGNNCCFTDHITNFNVDLHSDIHESIWFKLGLMIHTIVLYSMILLWLTLTLIQGHRSCGEQTLLLQLFHKVFNWFGWNVVYGCDLLVWWTSYSFYLIHSVFKGENPAYIIRAGGGGGGGEGGGDFNIGWC